MSKNKYDVIIAGGGTAGVSCAWNCGKMGLKTLLIEQNSFLGGSMTSSLVVPAMKTSENEINCDFYKNFYKILKKYNGAITYCDGNRGWFNPEIAKIALDIMMNDANVDVLFESFISDILTKDNKILSVSVETIYNDNASNSDFELSLPIETIYLIDGTGDAKIFEKLNCKFLENSDENYQPVNLRFIITPRGDVRGRGRGVRRHPQDGGAPAHPAGEAPLRLGPAELPGLPRPVLSAGVFSFRP